MQPNPKPKKRFNFMWLLLILLIILTVSLLYVIISHYVSNARTTITKDIAFFEKVLEETKLDTKDANYIKEWIYNPYNGNVKIVLNATSEVLNKLGVKIQTNESTFTFAVDITGTQMGINENLFAWKNIKNSFMYGSNGDLIGTHITAPAPTLSLSEKIFNLISKLLPIFSIIIFGYFIFSMLFRTPGIGGEFTKTQSPAVQVKTNKKFSDIAGNEEAKEEVVELIDYLKNPKKYDIAGARIPKGILLGGPPGTGKTLLAKATAGEANVPFFFISASNFVEMFVGLGAKRVRDMFEEARRNAPAIIFIDELDAVGRSRGAGIGGGNDEREQTLNQLLVEMDGIKENSGILIMAATNRTDVLDPALLRPGRFDRTINVALPDIKEREAILKLHARGKRISENIKFNLVARRTPGFSGAQLENVLNEASLLSVREKTGVITIEQIDEAIDRVIAGPAKKSRTISEKENIAVAYHEAGHAVVGLKIKGGNKVQKITIIPRGHAGGYNLMLPEEEKYNRSKIELIAMITSFMGGRAAEAIIYGKDNVSTGASDDIAKATRIARKMVTEYGLSDLGPIKYEEDTDTPFLGRDYMKNNSFSSNTAQEIDQEVRKIMLEAERNAYKIINENKKLLELIKDALILNETIVAEEIEYIEKHMKLPERMHKEKVELSKEYSKKDFETLFNEVTSPEETKPAKKPKTTKKGDNENN
ncbi:ATP-dependent zinc metalloprotease FtsH [Metamycoplasma hyosynoviae]|uniref:ATP-dependent zinc metalloprotease FtsH n=2 Tax=Metamycoplasma hyosynoviae TaxID=29559 RepID=UPI00235898C4|nr:ATP-dependent zinc metalloprotease FtsH [Metamycoplasma hyosynoviae]MDC8917594.1 ATP-dependent zinc metalloprotease FtsH [Metamycoplasma hyosynoviae]MDC8918805.1 ATP-dependent zinc metalloprotease FtsH [Metamycoplasma hyosynoviae]